MFLKKKTIRHITLRHTIKRAAGLLESMFTAIMVVISWDGRRFCGTDSDGNAIGSGSLDPLMVQAMALLVRIGGEERR